MNTICGYSKSNSAKEAVYEASKEIHNPKLIIYFSKIGYFKEVTELLRRNFGDSDIIGCTSCGEI